MYADLTGNREKHRIKSRCDNICEGRIIYDCFVLNEKAHAVYYLGSQPVLQTLNVMTSATDTNKSTVMVEPGALTGSKRYYDTATTTAGLIGVTYNSAITTGNWTELTANGLEITPTSGDKYIRVISVTGSANNYIPIAVGDAILNIG